MRFDISADYFPLSGMWEWLLEARCAFSLAAALTRQQCKTRCRAKENEADKILMGFFAVKCVRTPTARARKCYSVIDSHFLGFKIFLLAEWILKCFDHFFLYQLEP